MSFLRVRKVLVFIALSGTCGSGVFAQATKKAPSQEARRAELAQVQELLADPDPNLRLANMEAIVNSHDTTKLQLALRIVFHSDDPNMRALGVRAYIASLNDITFDVQFPAAVQHQYEEAQGDEDRMNALIKQHPYVGGFISSGLRLRLIFSKYDMTKNTGVLADAKVVSVPGAFTVSGDRVTGSFTSALNTLGIAPCSVDFRPTTEASLRGSLVCDLRSLIPRLSISAPIF
jgi:hypothetical protein